MKNLHTLALALVLTGCVFKKPSTPPAEGTFGYDLHFLRKYHQDLVVLGDTAGAAVVIAPAYQGRVMTSTVNGMNGPTMGWINHELIASGELQPHINAWGGEERFWIGPEGGQFGFYFPKNSAFTFENWQVPAALDTEPFRLLSSDERSATFQHRMVLENHSGTPFNLIIERTIRLLSRQRLDSLLHNANLDDVSYVAFETDNMMMNASPDPFLMETGLPSIWILSMLKAAPNTWIGVPWKKNLGEPKEKPINDKYFGQVPDDRLIHGDGLSRFKADAKFRSKIGVPADRAMPWICSYAPDSTGRGALLTLAFYTYHGASAPYVNSSWERQSNPFNGDVVNAYNDGPNESGSQMGDFYELESSSPGAALEGEGSVRHSHFTVHLTGSPETLAAIFRTATGYELSQLTGK